MSTRTCSSCGAEVGIGEWPWCPHGRPHGGTNLQAIHYSERPVVYRNPRTGDVRFPARADVPVPAVYAMQGFVREELTSPADIRRFEKETGRVHEQSNYDNGSATAERFLAEPVSQPLPETRSISSTGV